MNTRAHVLGEEIWAQIFMAKENPTEFHFGVCLICKSVRDLRSQCDSSSLSGTEGTVPLSPYNHPPGSI